MVAGGVDHRSGLVGQRPVDHLPLEVDGRLPGGDSRLVGVEQSDRPGSDDGDTALSFAKQNNHADTVTRLEQAM